MIALLTLLILISGASLVITVMDMSREEAVAMRTEDERMMEDEEMMQGEGMMESESESDFINLTVVEGDDLFTLGAIVELEGYYTTVDAYTTFDEQGETVSCAAFVIVDGPKEVLDLFSKDRYGETPTIYLGEEEGYYAWAWDSTTNVQDSTQQNPVRALFKTGSTFEGGVVGCMSPQIEFIATTE